MNNNKMPDGSFAVDNEQFEIVRDTKAPYIPIVKSKGDSGSFTPAAMVADATGENVVDLFNELLASLKAAGLMAEE